MVNSYKRIHSTTGFERNHEKIALVLRTLTEREPGRSFTIKDIIDFHNIPYTTIHYHLQAMVFYGEAVYVVEPRRRGYVYKYRATRKIGEPLGASYSV